MHAHVIYMQVYAGMYVYEYTHTASYFHVNPAGLHLRLWKGTHYTGGLGTFTWDACDTVTQTDSALPCHA